MHAVKIKKEWLLTYCGGIDGIEAGAFV